MLKNETLRRDADAIIRASLNAVLPDEAVRRALKNFRPQGGNGFVQRFLHRAIPSRDRRW